MTSSVCHEIFLVKLGPSQNQLGLLFGQLAVNHLASANIPLPYIQHSKRESEAVGARRKQKTS